MRISAMFFGLWIGLAGCTNQAMDNDAGVDAQAEDRPAHDQATYDDAAGDAQTESWPERDELGTDGFPGNTFQLRSAGGRALCSGFSEGRTFQQELALVSVIETLSGTWDLERRIGKSRLPSPLARVLVGYPPETIPIQETTLPVVAQFYDSGTGYREWKFQMVATLRRGAQAAELALEITIGSDDGTWPTELSFDQPQDGVVISARLFLAPGVDPRTEIQQYGMCNLPGPAVRDYQIQTASGTKASFELRRGPYGASCHAAGESACLFLVRASFERKLFLSTLTDRMRLVYNGSHHNWTDKYLLILDPADGTTRYVLLEETNYDGRPALIRFLDANLQEIGREAVLP